MKMIFDRNFAGAAALVLACAPLTIPTFCAADIKVVTSGPFTAAYLELVPEYERVTHDRLMTEVGSSTEQRITRFRCASNAVRPSMS